MVLICAPLSVLSQVDMPGSGMGQFGSFGGPGQSQGNDSLFSDKKGKKWENPAPVIHYKHWNSEVKLSIDTSISGIHEFDNFDAWTYNLGNLGTYARSFLFSDRADIGPQLSYQGYRPYFYAKDLIPFYNTTRPYSLFNYSLGGQQEQLVTVVHTQNLSPRLNMAAFIRNLNSPGYFNNQLAVSNGGYYTANYTSENQKYRAQGAVIYNKMRQDENGGILHDSVLSIDRYSNRKQIETVVTPMPTNRTRSKVTNMYREAHAFFTHEYRIGQTDTTYNEDSTQYSILFKPQWSFRHDFDLQMRKHLYEDKIPDRNKYLFIDPSIELLPNDTLRQQQVLNTIQNNFTINGFVGQYGRQMQVEAGIGNRIDLLRNYNRVNDDKNSFVNNYLIGQIRKEAIEQHQWSFGARALFYFAGSHIGDLNVEGHISKYFSNIGAFRLSARQTVQTPAYNVTDFKTNYFEIKNDFGKSSATHLEAQIRIDRLNIDVKFNNYLLYNHIYLSSDFDFRQYDGLIRVSHLEASHKLNVGRFSLISRGFIQQKDSHAPINLPQWGISEAITYSNNFYADKLQLIIGLQGRYIGRHQMAGYQYIFNEFYYNDEGIYTDNPIELRAFLNFRIKNLRAFVMVDQLQQVLIKENIMYVVRHPSQSFLFRFGFKWTLYN